MRRRSRAFTMVELLVVIGIAGLLIAMLLPTLRSARRHATQVMCVNTLQQMGKASLMHAQEHRGFMPLAGLIQVGGYAAGNTNVFPEMLNDAQHRRYTYALEPFYNNYTLVPLPGALAPYMMPVKFSFDDWSKLDIQLRSRDLLRHFVCPSTDSINQPLDPVTLTDAIQAKQGTMVAFSVAGTWSNPWASNGDYGMNEGALGFSFDSKYSTRRLRGHTPSFTKPDKLVLFTDAKPQTKLAFGFFCPWICWTPALDSTGPVTLADAWESNGKAEDRSMFDEKRHDGRLNVAYADGHVQTMFIKSDELKTAYLILP